MFLLDFGGAVPNSFSFFFSFPRFLSRLKSAEKGKGTITGDGDDRWKTLRFKTEKNVV